MNTMTKAHEIRKSAAVKWNCEASEFSFALCLKMAHAGEEIEVTEFKIENDECCAVESKLNADGAVTIKIETDAYNKRANSRPWIAIAADDEMIWGEWSHSWNNGEAGILTIVARPGDVVKEGQKNTRKNRSWIQSYTVQIDGSLVQN